MKHVDIEYSAELEKDLGLSFFLFHFKEPGTGKELSCNLSYAGRYKNLFDKAMHTSVLKRLWNLIFPPEYSLHHKMTYALQRAQILEKRAIAENKTLV